MAEKAIATGFDAVKLAPFGATPPRPTDPAKLPGLGWIARPPCAG